MISQMKNKNVKFNYFTEEQTKRFLENNSYYKKITSYENNFHYYVESGMKKYSDLDFAYLVELSTLDMEFRFLVLKMCLNIEHALKIIIINKCLEKKEDGYSIIKEYFEENENVKKEILQHANNSYCEELISENRNRIPIWVFLEVISFGELCRFCKFLEHKGYFQKWEIDVIFNVRVLRNAAAHNHCLFSRLIRTDVKPINKVRQYVEQMDGITKTQKNQNLKSRCIHDFVTLLFAFEYYIKSEGIINHTKEDMEQLFFNRMLQRKAYFKNCITVKNAYGFVKKVLDKWCEK